MEESAIKAQNLWASFARKVEPLARAATLDPEPEQSFNGIGGLAGPKEEIQTYACAATDPEVYERWGTRPPSGVLLVGQKGSGKTLLARALSTQAKTPFLLINVPRLAIDMVHGGNKVLDLVHGWSQALEEIPRITIFFDELEFSQAQELGERRTDLPVGPIMDFLLELLDRSIAIEHHLVVGATSHPDTLRHAFILPQRFERIVEVNPVFPDDVIAALQIHVRAVEKRAGRPLFDTLDWKRVVGNARAASPGDWVRILHAVLRRRARCEAAGEEVTPIAYEDFAREVDRFEHAQRRIRVPEGGNYV
jgi:SpoVK/Ycf46/Vps4 family AAA+-type ATPase